MKQYCSRHTLSASVAVLAMFHISSITSRLEIARLASLAIALSLLQDTEGFLYVGGTLITFLGIFLCTLLYLGMACQLFAFGALKLARSLAFPPACFLCSCVLMCAMDVGVRVCVCVCVCV